MRTATLNDVLLGIEAGKSFQTLEMPPRDDQLGVLKVSAVTWSSFQPNEAKVVENYQPDERHRVYRGDLLISRANTKELVGAVVLVEQDYPNRLLSDKTLRLIIDEAKADKAFLVFALRSAMARAHIEHYATGTSDSMRNISQGVITSIPISLPSLVEQRQIAARLKAQLAEVEKVRKGLEAQQQDLVSLANATIADSLKQGSAETVVLGDVLEEVKQGVGQNWKDFPVLGATRGGLALAKEPPGKYPERYKPVTPGTVFYNPMRINIGSIALVDEHDEAGITSPDYVALKGKSGKVNSRWFYYWLRSSSGEQCIASLARGAVRERMLFNRLAEAEVEIPDIKQQNHAAQILREIIPLQDRFTAQQQDLELLPSKLLAAVFGENAIQDEIASRVADLDRGDVELLDGPAAMQRLKSMAKEKR